jgi:lipopolysaccharide/colanic/teichoic acid biosynthesis glycosyltransferase
LYRAGGSNERRHLHRLLLRVLALLATDVAVVGLLTLVAPWALPPVGPLDVVASDPSHQFSRVSLAVAAAVVLGLTMAGAYRTGDGWRSPGRIFAGATGGTAISCWNALWTLGLLRVLPSFAAMLAGVGAVLILARLLVDGVVRWWKGGGHWETARTLFIGEAAACRQAMSRRAFSHLGPEYNLGLVEIGPEPALDARGHLANLAEVLHESGAEAIVLCGRLESALFHAVVETAHAAGCQVFETQHRRSVRSPRTVWRNGEPLIELVRPELKAGHLLLKKIVDLVGATVALVLCAPVMAIVWAVIRLDSRGPGIFVQPRVGRNGRVFGCFKFRTMYADAEQRLAGDPVLRAEYLRNNYKLPPERDPRVTRVGRAVRRWSLDELPQLVNVLRGEMSLVGPRPLVLEELGEYGSRAPTLLSLHPGMTGAWAIAGRSELGYPERCSFELGYVGNWSFGADMAILARTVPVVLLSRGAH